MSAVRYPFILKTSTFSIQDLRKHFQYVRYLYNSIAKLKIIFETTTLFRDIAHILYNKLPNDAVILYGYIRNTAHIVILVWQNQLFRDFLVDKFGKEQESLYICIRFEKSSLNGGCSSVG